MKEPLLFDTSVWIDFFKGANTKQVALLSDYLETDNEVLLSPTIIQEILQGIRSDYQYEKVKKLLSYIEVLYIPPVNAAIGSAELYRDLRKKGVTIRKSNDCLIAFFAIYFSIGLVHQDRDFLLIAQYTPLKIRD